MAGNLDFVIEDKSPKLRGGLVQDGAWIRLQSRSRSGLPRRKGCSNFAFRLARHVLKLSLYCKEVEFESPDLLLFFLYILTLDYTVIEIKV